MRKYKPFDELPLALSVKDLKEILSISQTMAYCLVRSGQVRLIMYGKQLYSVYNKLVEVEAAVSQWLCYWRR